MLAVGNAQDVFHIGGQAQINENQGANGGAIYCRSYMQDVPSILSIGDQVLITNNQADNSGGGIWFSGFRDESDAPSALTLAGNALISENDAVNGGGIYFYASNADDRLAITENASITGNTVSQNGGGCHLRANVVPANFSLENASITGNTAGTGGGIWITNQSQDKGVVATLTDIILEHNQASAHAGGMALYAGGKTLDFHMTGGTVSNNLAAQEGGEFVISNDG